MSVKLIIQNFEIIKSAKIAVEGITCIVGETDNGKTAVYNAVKVLAYNILGDGYIRKVKGKKVKEGCKVALLFGSDGLMLKFLKSDSAAYLMQLGEDKWKMEKVGRNQPPDIIQALNMEPLEVDGVKFSLNFIDQLQEPLLKKMSEIQLYKATIKSFDGEKIQEAIKLCKVDADLARETKKQKEIALTTRKEIRLSVINELESYTWLDEIEDEFKEYDTAYRSLPQLTVWNKERQALISQISEQTNVANCLLPIDGIKSGMDKAVKLIRGITAINDISQRRSALKSQIQDNDNTIVLLKPLHGSMFTAELKEVLSTKDRVTEILGWYNERLSLQTDISYVDKTLDAVKPLTWINEDLEKATKLSKLCDYAESAITLRANLKERILDNNKVLESIKENLKHKQHIVDNKLCPMCESKLKQGMEIDAGILETIEKLKKQEQNAIAKKELLEGQLRELDAKVKKNKLDPEKLPEKIKEMQKRVTDFQDKVRPELEKMKKAVSDIDDSEHQAEDFEGFDSPELD